MLRACLLCACAVRARPSIHQSIHPSIDVPAAQVFENFLGGVGLDGCYESVARIANFWLDVLDSQAEDMEEDEVIDLMSERKSLSRALSDYGSQKSTAITTANRLAQFLGQELVQNSGLSCHLLISKEPRGAPVTQRAIPVAIFGAKEAVKVSACVRECVRERGSE